ncbi:hypothetical protein RKE25_23055 (plasmid) [Dyella sp. BiH032]|uniref:hypothetical protein n=1 Tax=Dyella sp. BiH032 TaxID=3075430 RepID=UPI0028931EE4|nr:hypothetical protein [Dyella sp. BiH032]WNL48564.1 hypothetical protein RKE25_23055 [Dyella sp. BiH032]
MTPTELMQRLRTLPRIKKFFILIAGPLGSIGLGMIEHPILALIWYLTMTILFVSITKPAAVESVTE